MANVRLEAEGEVARITLSRSFRANALDSATIVELRDAVRESAAANPRVLVMAGDGVFCGGADIREMEGLDAVGAERFIRGLHEAFLAIREHPAPVIAEVRGAALGAGLELLVSCDLSVAADDAVFGMPEPHVGLPSVIEAALLPGVVGLGRARELLFLGDPIDGRRGGPHRACGRGRTGRGPGGGGELQGRAVVAPQSGRPVAAEAADRPLAQPAP